MSLTILKSAIMEIDQDAEIVLFNQATYAKILQEKPHSASKKKDWAKSVEMGNWMQKRDKNVMMEICSMEMAAAVNVRSSKAGIAV